jgi:ubiquinone/menaquinone biosynthesis C-methylase UbiE
MKLDNPLLVGWEYASEERFAKRTAMFHALLSGGNPDHVAYETVAEANPKRILDVGCGLGETTERFVKELGADVQAIDLSPRMVELSRMRGIDAHVGDVQALPFADGAFDCVFAGWVFYHVPDLEKAVAECARVLRPGGRLVASSYFENNMDELWNLIDGLGPREALSFSHTNGGELLQRYFATVERRDFEATLTFPDTQSIREFVASTIDRAHLAPLMPEVDGPFCATTRHVIFIAEKGG